MLCPKCGASNDDSSKFCLSCGGPLQQAVPPQTPPPVPPVTPVPPYQAPAQAGHPVPPYQPPVGPPEKAKKGKGCLIALIIFLILAIAGAAVFFFVIKKGVFDAFDVLDDIYKQTTVSDQKTQQQTIPQGEDGITFNDGDDTVQLGGQWPNSPLLKDVPKPAFGSIFSVSTSDDEVAVTFSGWNQEQLMDYIGLVKAAGFTKNAEEMTIMGMSTYEADNGSVRLEIVQAMGYYAITVEKL
ncbi:MAG TPA: zinc ribbon domain-containing protein [Clostridia bacterium]|nr:zinc ribbon domain-containing protein [Clostridia bacterium]